MPIGERLNKIYKENLDETEILNELDQLFAKFAAGRQKNESFGDFVVRKGRSLLLKILQQNLKPGNS